MSEKDIEELKKVVKEAIHAELSIYKVDKEQHYRTTFSFGTSGSGTTISEAPSGRA